MPESSPDQSGLQAYQQTQFVFAAHLRDPAVNPAPLDIEDRRMKIYRELVYNNIESFIATGFPVLRQLIADQPWHDMIRDFVSRHCSHSPYFLEISQEFLKYLQEERQPLVTDPPFMLELAHYEWVELAPDVSEENIPESLLAPADLMTETLQVSPLAWRLSYQYPVHMIGLEYQPREPPEQPTFLVVYRNREHRVKFLETNAVTIRLLQLLESPHCRGMAALQATAAELKHDNPEAIIRHGGQLLEQLYRLDIVITPVKAP
ncbi:HvfC family RiPP maturation protein [Porticoccus sp.]|uniref:HvfC family RiPP maturation protein n=1 Tax=Porticoccus sp. TaxID=2024853 RepID=UPI003F69932F